MRKEMQRKYDKIDILTQRNNRNKNENAKQNNNNEEIPTRRMGTG